MPREQLRSSQGQYSVALSEVDSAEEVQDHSRMLVKMEIMPSKRQLGMCNPGHGSASAPRYEAGGESLFPRNGIKHGILHALAIYSQAICSM